MATVVVADDDPDIREMVVFKLEQEGHQVIAVGDGQEALSEIRSRQPDLALLDIMMPKMTGDEVCRQLRADDATATIPVIFLTARVQDVDIQAGLASGGAGYIGKPFSSRELMVRANMLLQRTR
jgi:two-component system, OmpR family, phosphate regulon response regulator PhoB